MTMTAARRLFALMSLMLLLLILQFGCGGNGGSGASTGKGAAALSITWPSRARLIPAAADSIRIVISEAGVILANQLVVRPAGGGTSNLTISDLKPGTPTLTATAYPNVDGTGTAQATGVTNVTIVENRTTNVSLTMNSTIDHLEVSPSPIAVLVGADTQLVVTAKDASNAVVLITPGKITFQPSTGAVTVDSNGLAHAAGPGSGQITITETESAKQVTDQYTITSPVIGVLYAADTKPGGLVGSLNPSLTSLGNIGAGTVSYPSGVAVDSAGNLYVGEYGNGTGRTIRKFSPAGADLGVFATLPAPAAPVSIHFDTVGNLIVLASTGPVSASLYKVSANGATVTPLATIANLCREMTLDAVGNIYVSIYGFTNNILKFSSGGTALGVFVSVTNTYPSGMAFDAAGNLYVSGFADALGDTVQKYSSTGVSLGTFATGLNGPWGLAFDTGGNLYVAEYISGTVKKFSPTGALLGTSAAFVSFPSAIVFRPGL
jgi:sugar lactone lactonase YvrE